MPARRLVLAGCGAVLVGTLGGCASAEADPDVHGSGATAGVAEVAGQSSAYQREILADGQVSFAEYERAVGMVVECLTDSGMEVTAPEPRDGDPRFLDFSFQLQRSDGQQGRLQRMLLDSYETCAGEYLTDVETAWFQQHQLPPAERERQRRHVAECLQGAGLDISSDIPHHDLHHEVEHHLSQPAVQACRQQYPDYFVPEAE